MTLTHPRRPLSRWSAAAIHLSISALIGLGVAALLWGLWYPPPYFHAGGADQLVLLLVGVDLGLGPLLTLIVFRSGKRGLKFDLAVIGLAQAAALVYGLGVVLQSRPIFLVGAVDRFVLVAANEITDADLALGKDPAFRERSWTGPRLVIGQLPEDPDELSDLGFAGLAGRDLQNQPRYFHDYHSLAKTMLTRAKPLSGLRKAHPQDNPTLDAWLAGHARKEDDVRWLPLVARKSDLVMLVDAGSGEPLGALQIEPNW